MKMTTAFGIGLSLFLIFTSSIFLMFAWRLAIGYYLLILIGSFFAGAVTANVERALKLFSLAYVASCFAFVLLYILPPTLYGEASPGEINDLVGLVSSQLARTAILSFPVAVFACLFGSFSGKALTEG